MYEHKTKPLLPKAAFLIRLFRHSCFALFIVFGSLAIGILGYHELESLPWIDSLVNAAMILGGMGPVNQLCTYSGKIFAAFYALFSGLVFLVAVGVIFVPVFHRIIHKFHLESER